MVTFLIVSMVAIYTVYQSQKLDTSYPRSVDMIKMHAVSWILVTYFCCYDQYACCELDSGCLFLLI
jgi:hypothetical protein